MSLERCLRFIRWTCVCCCIGHKTQLAQASLACRGLDPPAGGTKVACMALGFHSFAAWGVCSTLATRDAAPPACRPPEGAVDFLPARQFLSTLLPGQTPGAKTYLESIAALADDAVESWSHRSESWSAFRVKPSVIQRKTVAGTGVAFVPTNCGRGITMGSKGLGLFSWLL